MQKWEYKFMERKREIKQVGGLTYPGDWSNGVTLEDLTALGEEGWELAGIVPRSEPTTIPGAATLELWVFKRIRGPLS